MTEPRTYQAPPTVGACMAGLAIPDAVTIFHGGAGCEIKLHSLLVSHNPTGDVHFRVVNTKVSEADLVLDAGEVLARSAGDIAARAHARLVLVTSASFIEIAGIDRDRLSADLERRVGVPVVYAYAPDFAGDLFDGYQKAIAAVAARAVRDARPAADRSGRVNVAGYVFDRPFGDHEGNLAEVRALVEGLGLRLNATLLDGSPAATLERLPAAEACVTLPGGGPAADILASALGQPRVDVELPIGLDATRAFVATVAAAAGAGARAEALLEGREREVRGRVRQAAGSLAGRRVALFADGAKVRGLLGLCRDLRLKPILAGVLDGRVGGIEAGCGMEVLSDPGQRDCLDRIETLARAGELDLVIGPWVEALAARRAGVAGVEFGFPCRWHVPLGPCPYMGHGGVLAMASRLILALGAA